MKIKAEFSVLAQTKWHEYAVRFVLGGAITVLTGLIAKRFGPTIGGLFLAFPAIFPASATLIEKHEKQKKLRAGVPAGNRGPDAAALDAAGAAMGSVALLGFASVVWLFLPTYPSWAVLTGGIALWLSASILIWMICEHC